MVVSAGIVKFAGAFQVLDHALLVGQRHGDLRARANAGLGDDPPAVQLGDGPAQRQAQPQPVRRGVHPVAE